MADIVDRATRSRMMSGIRSQHTKPELLLRKALHARGFRFKLHDRTLAGKPDLVLPRYSAVIFVHGCFWHGHDCRFFKLPSTRPEFWKKKIDANRANDDKAMSELLKAGWRVGIIWECALRGKNEQKRNRLADRMSAWLQSDRRLIEARE